MHERCNKHGVGKYDSCSQPAEVVEPRCLQIQVSRQSASSTESKIKNL
jgi:hypothetical protein